MEVRGAAVAAGVRHRVRAPLSVSDQCLVPEYTSNLSDLEWTEKPIGPDCRVVICEVSLVSTESELRASRPTRSLTLLGCTQRDSVVGQRDLLSGSH